VLEAEAVIVRVGADQLAEVTALSAPPLSAIVTPESDAPIVKEDDGKVNVTVLVLAIPVGVVNFIV